MLVVSNTSPVLNIEKLIAQAGFRSAPDLLTQILNQ
jgi:hypothetical protein